MSREQYFEVLDRFEARLATFYRRHKLTEKKNCYLLPSGYPDVEHAVVALPDSRKGEQLVLVTTALAEWASLPTYAAAHGIAALTVPVRS